MLNNPRTGISRSQRPPHLDAPAINPSSACLAPSALDLHVVFGASFLAPSALELLGAFSATLLAPSALGLLVAYGASFLAPSALELLAAFGATLLAPSALALLAAYGASLLAPSALPFAPLPPSSPALHPTVPSAHRMQCKTAATDKGEPMEAVRPSP